MSWGSHACTYVGAATLAMIEAKGRRGTCLHGRCLLETDGTVDVAAEGNLISASPQNASNFTTSVGIDVPELNDLINAYGAASDASSSSLENVFTTTTPGVSATPLTNRPPTLSSPTNTLPFPPIPSLNSTSPILPDPGSSLLNCPCNCTYVSPSCCLTRDVWDDPMGQIQMAPLSANASVVCDSGTGRWVGKSGKDMGD